MSEKPSANGIYSAYLAGAAGNSFGVFLIKDGIIAGGDGGGGVYDGSYTLDEDGNNWSGVISFTLPTGGATITGQVATHEPIKFDVPIKLPLNFASSSFVRIESPTGPLNARFVLIRKL